MREVYHADFMVNLIFQAVDKEERYKPVLHNPINNGDIVLLVDKHLKQYRYPMGRFISVERNSIGVTTAARILKGDTREMVYRHVTSLILLLPGELCEANEQPLQPQPAPRSSEAPIATRPKSTRTAAKKCNQRLSLLTNQGSV